MSVDCLLFHGIGHEHPISTKQAGAARIATELRKNGFQVQVIDCKGLSARNPLWRSIIKKFVGPDTLWVGFSTTITGNVLGIYQNGTLEFDPEPFKRKPDDSGIWINEFMDLVRQQNPSIEFVHGGAGSYDFRDYGWWKFSYGTDQSIVDFTKWLRDPSSVLDFKHSDRLVTSTGFRDFSTSTIEWRKEDIIEYGQTLPIELTRGCIFKCKFCSFPYNGKKSLDFIKNSAVLRDEFERNYAEWGTTEYLFSDDTYNDSLDKMKILHDEVFSKLSFKLGFSTYARLDLLERQGNEGIDLLLGSGLTSAVFGIESLNPPSARAIGKSGGIEKQLDFLRRLKRQAPDIYLGSGFILGLPHDDKAYLDGMGDWFLSDENPLDWWNVESLYISPPDMIPGRDFYSEIDTNPESHGYQILPHSDETRKVFKNRWRVNWRLNDVDLSYCVDKEREIFERSLASDKFRAGGFMYSTYRNLGFSKDQIRSSPYKLLTVSEEQKAKRINDYYQKILSL